MCGKKDLWPGCFSAPLASPGALSRLLGQDHISKPQVHSCSGYAGHVFEVGAYLLCSYYEPWALRISLNGSLLN